MSKSEFVTYSDLSANSELSLEKFKDGSVLIGINGEEIELEPSQMVHLGRTLIEQAHKQIENRQK